ncbi:hypothetical protein LTSEMON_3521, partial [Salmonella enterica subsp. enterica serovar Montevideo str. S5-403]
VKALWGYSSNIFTGFLPDRSGYSAISSHFSPRHN